MLIVLNICFFFFNSPKLAVPLPRKPKKTMNGMNKKNLLDLIKFVAQVFVAFVVTFIFLIAWKSIIIISTPTF